MSIALPKLFLFDTGVYRSLRPAGPLDRPQEIEGAALEGLVAQHLRAWAACGGSDFDLFYWHTRAGTEIDFIVYGPLGFWAVEVRHAATVRSEDVRALRAFATDYPEAEPILVYRGEQRLMVNGVRCLPVHEFLAELRPGRSPGQLAG